jgi:galactokinase
MQVLGGLMNDSHASCRDLFDVSCPELEALTGLARCVPCSARRCRTDACAGLRVRPAAG